MTPQLSFREKLRPEVCRNRPGSGPSNLLLLARGMAGPAEVLGVGQYNINVIFGVHGWASASGVRTGSSLVAGRQIVAERGSCRKTKRRIPGRRWRCPRTAALHLGPSLDPRVRRQ